MENNASANVDGITLLVRTMGGAEHRLENLDEVTTLQQVKMEMCQRMGAPHFCVKFIIDGDVVERLTQTLSELGLVGPDASIVVIRVPGDSNDWNSLFEDLLKAFYQGDHAEVRRLIDVGAGFDADGNLLKQSFHAGACKVGSGPGSTMLHLAVRHKLTDLALQVIRYGADVNVPNEHGRTALLQASIKQDEVLVDALLEAKADPLVHDRDDKYAYSYALQKSNDKLACRLLKASFSASKIKHPPHGGYAVPAARDLLMACAYSTPQTALALIEQGADVNARDEQNCTALHYAYSNKLSEVMQALLAKGADPKVEDVNGRRPEDFSSSSKDPSSSSKCTLM